MSSEPRPISFPHLNPIVDADASERAGWTVVDLARAFFNAGATFVQLRVKTWGSGRFLDAAGSIAELAHEAGAIFIVNDRADIAWLAGAAGVHVGQDDLTPAAVRGIVGDRAIVGVSTHTAEQMATAVSEPVSYVAVGPVFGTATKHTGYDAVGLEGVRRGARQAVGAKLPLVAIGGITLEHAADVIQAGATSVAVIGDLLVTGDPEGRVREYLVRLQSVTKSLR